MCSLISHQLYNLIWKKIPEESDDSIEYGLTSLHLQDTLVIEDSTIKNWYFVSIKDHKILRKSRVNITNKHILHTFTAGVHPQAVCAFIAFVDLSPSLEVHSTLRYLVPAQLETLLVNMKSYCLTGIIQKVNKLGRPHNFGKSKEDTAVPDVTPCLQRPVSSLTVKLNSIEAKKRQGNTGYTVAEQGYSLLRVIWTPKSSCIEARRSKIGFDSYRYSPDVRCCTFFMGGEFQMVTIPTSLFYRINTLLTHLAIHISAQKQKQMVDRLVVYMQLYKLEEKNTQISLLFAEEIIVNGRNIDAEMHDDWQQKIRRNFRPPFILPYDIVKKVYIAITNPLIVHQMPDEYRDVYAKVANLGYEVQDGEKHVEFQREDVARHILKSVNRDIGTSLQEQAYQFISKVACEFAGSTDDMNENMVHITEITINKQCVRCQAPRCAHRLPFKLLLSEPFSYIAQKYTVFLTLFPEASIADLYRLLHYILTNDKDVFKYRDILIITMNAVLTRAKASPRGNANAPDPAGAHALATTPCVKELMANRGHLIDLFFSVYKSREDVLLPFDKLQNFFNMSSITIASCVPVHLLQRCGVPEFNVDAFLRRLDEDYFIYKLYPVCQRCTNELLEMVKNLVK